MSQRAIPKLPITENRIEKILLFRILLSLLFRQMGVKLLVLFGPHCISQPIIKIMSRN